MVNDNTRSSTISSQVCIWQHITSRNDELYLFFDGVITGVI